MSAFDPRWTSPERARSAVSMLADPLRKAQQALMHFVLRPDPAHDRRLAPSLNVSGERVRTEHSVNSQFVWSGESGEQARYRQIRPTEAIADKVGAAVCKLACVSPRQSLSSLILAPLPYRGSSCWP